MSVGRIKLEVDQHIGALSEEIRALIQSDGIKAKKKSFDLQVVLYSNPRL